MAQATKGILSALNIWSRNRSTRAALSRLGDRELEDIGFTRGDIEARFG